MENGHFSASQWGISNYEYITSFSDGTSSNAGGWLDQLCMVCFSWIPSITHMLFILRPQSIMPVTQDHFRGLGKILPPQVVTRVQPPSHELLLLASVSSRLKSGLPSPCTALKQGCCSAWGSAQYHLSSSCSYLLHCLLSFSCNLATCSRSFSHDCTCSYDIHCCLHVPGGISSYWSSMQPKVWTAIPVLERTVWVETSA